MNSGSLDKTVSANNVITAPSTVLSSGIMRGVARLDDLRARLALSTLQRYNAIGTIFDLDVCAVFNYDYQLQ